MSDADAYAAAELGTALRGGAADEIRQFAGLIDDRKALKLLNYYDSLFDEPVEETDIGREIIANAATETVDDAVGVGNVSQMKNAMGLTNRNKDGGDIYGGAARRLALEGSIGLVFGAPGSGKTALTLDVAKAWQLRTGGSIIGNTTWSGFDEVVHSDREMFEAMGARRGQVLAIIDEAAQDLSGFGEGNKRAERFSDALLHIRKRVDGHGDHPKRGSVLAVSHTRKKTAKPIREVASFGIEKPSRENPDKARLLDSEGDRDEWEVVESFQGITDSTESYPEHEASTFEIDTADTDTESDVKTEKDHAIQTTLKAKLRGDTHDEAAALLDYGSSWVGDRWREWLRGEHRDLVDMPNNPPDHVSDALDRV